MNRLANRDICDGEQLKRRNPKHCGFTLVELLVVIAIIGVLLALILPAVQAAREASRRSQCQNNLKQLTLGLMNFEATNQKFPAGQRWAVPRSDPNAYSLAWSALLLPFIEQQVISDKIDFSYPLDDPRNIPATSITVPLYLCPSTSQFEEHRSEAGQLFDLGGLAGEGMACMDYLAISGPHKDTKNPTSKELYGRQRGIITGTKGLPNAIELLEPPPVKAKHVTDGLSKTTWLTECTGRGVDVKNDQIDAIHGAWASGVNVTHIDKGINEVEVPKAWYDERIHADHPGGAHFAMCDGSVHFFSDDTSKKVIRAMCSRDGEEAEDYSPF